MREIRYTVWEVNPNRDLDPVDVVLRVEDGYVTETFMNKRTQRNWVTSRVVRNTYFPEGQDTCIG
ncbi:MAG: hypothetical protein AMS18_00355 [Gemmatimonas sp. SG8_17]|nr:MAG: hypothetical protein AMS18_00355 [Gemmatimonas sp. SG8_17]